MILAIIEVSVNKKTRGIVAVKKGAPFLHSAAEHYSVSMYRSSSKRNARWALAYCCEFGFQIRQDFPCRHRFVHKYLDCRFFDCHDILLAVAGLEWLRRRSVRVSHDIRKRPQVHTRCARCKGANGKFQPASYDYRSFVGKGDYRFQCMLECLFVKKLALI